MKDAFIQIGIVLDCLATSRIPHSIWVSMLKQINLFTGNFDDEYIKTTFSNILSIMRSLNATYVKIKAYEDLILAEDRRERYALGVYFGADGRVHSTDIKRSSSQFAESYAFGVLQTVRACETARLPSLVTKADYVAKQENHFNRLRKMLGLPEQEQKSAAEAMATILKSHGTQIVKGELKKGGKTIPWSRIDGKRKAEDLVKGENEKKTKIAYESDGTRATERVEMEGQISRANALKKGKGGVESNEETSARDVKADVILKDNAVPNDKAGLKPEADDTTKEKNKRKVIIKLQGKTRSNYEFTPASGGSIIKD